MKKKLLHFLFLLFVITNAKAQSPDFDYDVTAQNAAAATSAGGSLSQGGITMTTGTSAITVDGSYRLININGATATFFDLTSANDIRQLTVQFRGAGGTATAGPEVLYGVNSTTTVAAPAQNVTGTTNDPILAPGQYRTYSFPIGTKYVRLNRGATTVRVYRVVASSSAFTLPLDFLSITAKPDAFGKIVDLNWSTTNEVNTKNFEIQRRTDNTEFATIGKVDSKNTAGVHNYSFVDNHATSGTAYYRVLQFDNDGASKPSTIVSVTNKSVATLSIYPNPVGDVLNVNHASATESASYKVLSLDGKVMLQQGATANTSSASINVFQLKPGAYMLVFDNSGSSSVKFIKSR